MMYFTKENTLIMSLKFNLLSKPRNINNRQQAIPVIPCNNSFHVDRAGRITIVAKYHFASFLAFFGIDFAEKLIEDRS
jgi:hypothetical protein